MKMCQVMLIFIFLWTTCHASNFNMTIYYSSNIFNYMFRKSAENISDTYLTSFISLANARNNLKQGKSPPFVFLNPGNTVDQNLDHIWPWYMDFMNILKPTAAGLSWFKSAPTIYGMKEYFQLAKFPILACNLSPKDPVMSKTIEPSAIVAFGKTKIGIIGYVSEMKTNHYSEFENLGYFSEIEGLWNECTRLEKMGVQIVIAIGLSDLMTDLRIAEAVECLDIVIGSDFEIFSWNNTPLVEFRDIREPIIVQNFNGKRIPVLQLHDRVLGEVSVSFNDQGHLINVGREDIAEFNENYTALEYLPSGSDRVKYGYLFIVIVPVSLHKK